MRCYVFAAMVGVFSTLLAGCGGDTPPPAATPSDSREPASPPPPPPPSVAGATAPSAAGSGRHPFFPGAVTEPPAWGDSQPPFDLAEFLEAPSAEENAAPLYLDALFEFSQAMAELFPPGEQRRRKPIAKRREERYDDLERKRRSNPASVSDAEMDACLAEFRTGFQKLALAQQRPRCVFQTGFGLASGLPHAYTARRLVASVVVSQTRRDLARGNFDRPIWNLETVLRLSRDLRPRGTILCQLASIYMDNRCCEQILPMILTTPAIQPEHCNRLIGALAKHETDAIDPFLESFRAEYFTARGTLRDFQHRTGMFEPRVMKEEFGVRGLADSPAARIKVLTETLRSSDYSSTLARQKWSSLFDRRSPAAVKQARQELQRQLETMTPDDYLKEADALNRVYASILALTEKTNLQRSRVFPALVEPLRETTLAVFLEPDARAIEAFIHSEAILRSTKCLIALRRWQLQHPELPKDLDTLVKAAGMDAVPLDPYCDEPLRMTVIDGRLVVYSVGQDGRDDKAQSDWKFGAQPGDFIFRLEPPSD